MYKKTTSSIDIKQLGKYLSKELRSSGSIPIGLLTILLGTMLSEQAVAARHMPETKDKSKKEPHPQDDHIEDKTDENTDARPHSIRQNDASSEVKVPSQYSGSEDVWENGYASGYGASTSSLSTSFKVLLIVNGVIGGVAMAAYVNNRNKIDDLEREVADNKDVAAEGDADAVIQMDETIANVIEEMTALIDEPSLTGSAIEESSVDDIANTVGVDATESASGTEVNTDIKDAIEGFISAIQNLVDEETQSRVSAVSDLQAADTAQSAEITAAYETEIGNLQEDLESAIAANTEADATESDAGASTPTVLAISSTELSSIALPVKLGSSIKAVISSITLAMVSSIWITASASPSAATSLLSATSRSRSSILFRLFT